ncbi:hypothetical protein J4H92_11925 [Leucobacter weissii]|uniref:ABC-three component systems C-terminal domain-containing protein n=1 Tax=Leucobacter weissii TaxID=1983706 RepID=A0A939MKI0_9MICO|nr:ABC-three component system protein [Leucobacter weissii]MBO1902654.1 hypothetical protein [Leucobacter weissii]
MSLSAQLSEGGGAPEMGDLPSPSLVGSPTPALPGPPVPPAHRIYFYSSSEWETFIAEWATGVAVSYRQIKQLGGSGDRGVDIAAFKTDRGLEDAWDCFQAKHYAGSLSMSDAFPEMLKVFHGVTEAFYRLPDRYVFVAPKGCGASLNRLLSRPTALQKKFLELLDAEAAATRLYDAQTLQSIRQLAESSDFSIFQSLELNEMLDVHRTTPYYAARFGTSLPARPPVGQTPDAPAPSEAIYVKKLVDAYHEQAPATSSDVESASAHPKHGPHLQRQREAFYSAEAFRLYARDSVPEGTYELLQDDVYTGVVDTAEANHPSGLDRLRAVLTQSGQLDLGAHTLISMSNLKDRQGICHQLANADKLTWVAADE